ncbi:MAG: DUF2853 family protein [Bacteroidetes bacterium]|nr:DUF2853 family protein [Bacteroidota bacterium]
MSKFDDAVAKNVAEAKKCGIKVNEDLLAKVAKGLGPSLYKADAEKVAFSDKAEMDRLKANFLGKKLGVTDEAKIDKALAEIKEQFGAANRNKLRALTYYLLVKKFKKESLYA